MARPIITTDSVGCREVVEDGVTGYLVPPRDRGALVAALARFMSLRPEDQGGMGRAARQRMLEQFDESIVIDRYKEVVRAVAPK